MARRRQFARGAAAISQRRLTQWFRSADVSVYTSLGGSSAILDQQLANITEPVTCVRMRGSIDIISDQEIGIERPFGAVGACVVSDQALAAGVGSVPTPITDKDSDLWVMHQYFHAPVTHLSSVGYTKVNQTFEFDSKAMRKIPADTTLIWVVESGSTVGMRYLLQFATLIKLA